MLWFGGFIGLVLLLILWAVVIAPGRARALFAKLETQGWERVGSEDDGLRGTVEALRPFDLTSYLADDGERPSATIDSALARDGRTRYLVQVRVHSKDAFNDNQVSFSTLALGSQRPTFPASSVYVLDRTLEARAKRSAEVLGLRKVESGLDPGFAHLFLVLDGAGERGRYMPRVCLRLVPSGWALLVPEPITANRQMRAFLDAVDAVSRALSR